MKSQIVSSKVFAAKVKQMENADNAYFLRPVLEITDKDSELFNQYETQRLKDYQDSLKELLTAKEFVGQTQNTMSKYHTDKFLEEIKFINKQVKRIEKSAWK